MNTVVEVRYPSVHIHSEFPDSAPIDKTKTYSTLCEARTDLALWVRECRRDLNIILFREGRGRFYAMAVNSLWEGTRELRG